MDATKNDNDHKDEEDDDESEAVNPQVITAVCNNKKNDPDDPNRRMLDFSGMSLNRPDAILIVGALSPDKFDDDCSPTPKRPTVLILVNVEMSEEALDVLCSFLRNAEASCLQALHLAGFPSKQVHRLLEALHNNKFVKELYLCVKLEMQIPGTCSEESGTWIATLLQHKKDFVTIAFATFCGSPNTDKTGWARALSIGLCQGQPDLRKLSFEASFLGSQGVDVIVRSLEQGQFDSLQELNFNHNFMTSIGLLSLSRLVPAVLPCLKKLSLHHNPGLLDEGEITWRFVQAMLLSNDTILKDLSIQNCARISAGFNIILQALETNRALHSLDMSDMRNMAPSHIPNIAAMLITSIPHMKGLRYLVCDEILFEDALNRRNLMAAYFKSTSLLKLSAI